MSKAIKDGGLCVDVAEVEPEHTQQPHAEDGSCPKCGSHDIGSGYGLAGGGCGPYWFCNEDACTWFYKEDDVDMAVPAKGGGDE